MILFIALSSWNGKPGDWSKTDLDQIPRQCPQCQQTSIYGHGKRKRQAHDETHAWITVRRGRCKLCRQSFTFLPGVCIAHSRYSLVYWLTALRSSQPDKNPEEKPARTHPERHEPPPLADSELAVERSTVGRWRKRWLTLRQQFIFLSTQIASGCEELCHKLLSRRERNEVAISPGAETADSIDGLSAAT
jgi:hypothetical protein